MIGFISNPHPPPLPPDTDDALPDLWKKYVRDIYSQIYDKYFKQFTMCWMEDDLESNGRFDIKIVSVTLTHLSLMPNICVVNWAIIG